MPALDPFSASSRPMPPCHFDEAPSKPLPFAATLHAIDLNTDRKLPKPRREKDRSLPNFPPSPYGHARHGSLASSPSLVDTNAYYEVGTDEWLKKEIERCVDEAKGELDLKGKGLKTLSTRITDLKDLVTLPRNSPRAVGGSTLLTPSPGQHPFSARQFSRAVSAPVRSALATLQHNSVPSQLEPSSALLTSPELSEIIPGGKRSFGRSKTGVMGPVRDLHLFLGTNSLTSLPSALFEVTNLTCLSLRSNKLTCLPAGIGHLVNLTELNISNNQIIELPSTILNLNLNIFNVHPNPFLQPVTHCENINGRLLSPITRHCSNPVPSLVSMCLFVLLSSPTSTELPPFLDAYDWPTPTRGESNPLLDVHSLHEIIPNLSISDLRRVLQTSRSASNAFGRINPSRYNPFLKSSKSSKPDDASTNPYYYPCPSNQHKHRLFLHPAEERHEWVDICGNTSLPVKYMGCSVGCLSFLERGADEDWSLEED